MKKLLAPDLALATTAVARPARARPARAGGVLGLVLALAAVLTPTAAVAQSCVPAPPNMVAWWPFDETSGPISHDIAGYANDGVWMNNPAPVAGMVAGALQFDGATDFVEVPDQAELNFGTGNFSIDAWVRTSAASGPQPILDKRTTANGGVGYMLFLTSGILAFQFGTGSQFANYTSTAFVADGQWHHVAVTVQRMTSSPLSLVLFVDGAPAPGGTFTAPQLGNLTNTTSLWIGKRHPILGARWFTGDLDEVELFNRDLTPLEVQGIFNAGSAGKCKSSCVQPPSGMVAWYPLDEQIGASAVNDIAPGFQDVGTPHDLFGAPTSISAFGGPPAGPAPVSGQVGAGALYFYEPYVEVPASADLDFTGNFSIDAWVRAVQCGPGGLSPIVDKWDPNSNIGFRLDLEQISSGTAFINLRINGSFFSSSGTFPADANPMQNTGSWVHVAVTVDRTAGVNTTFYINGSPAGAFYLPPTGSITNTVPMWIGKIRSQASYCEIAIDELELFNRVLTQPEVLSIFAAGSNGKCRPAGCTLTCTASASPASGPPPLTVAFTAAAVSTGCTGIVIYDWDFGDGSAHSSLQNPTHAYASTGAFAWTLTASVDGQTCTQTGTVQAVCPRPVINSVTKLTSPFRLKLAGPAMSPVNFDPLCTVFIGSTLWTNRTVNTAGWKIVLKQGLPLKTLFPVGVPVTITVVNPDGCSATITYTRM